MTVSQLSTVEVSLSMQVTCNYSCTIIACFHFVYLLGIRSAQESASHSIWAMENTEGHLGELGQNFINCIFCDACFIEISV